MSSRSGPSHRRRLWGRRGLVILIGALLAVAIVAPVAAAEILSDDEPRVAQNETVTDDIYIFGGDAEIAGTVTRDATVVSGRFELASTGRIDGNLNLLAGEANLHGDVGRTVRVAAGNVEIRGAIGSDLIVAGGQVDLERGALVRGDVILAGGQVTIRGDVGGEIRGATGELTVDGNVSGDVDVSVGDLTLGSRARIAGGLEYKSDDDLDQNQAAVVSGGIEQQEPDVFLPGDSGVTWLSGLLFRLLCALVAGAVIILAAPRLGVSIANGVRHRLPGSLLGGLILLVATPIVLTILMVTIVGIPIALIGWAAFFAALYLSQVFVGLAIGRFILPNRWGDLGRGYNLLAMTIGVIILAALRLIPVPWLDVAISAVIALIGLGAVVMSTTVRRHQAGFAPGS